MTRLLYTVALLLALVCSAHAQTTAPVTLSTLDVSCGATTSCLTYPLTGNAISIDVTVTGTITLTFEASLGDGTTYRSVTLTRLSDLATVTTTTASGTFALGNTGVGYLRIRVTSVSGGSAVIRSTKGLVAPRAAVLPNSELASKGTGTASGPVSAVIHVDTTQAATGANTNETTLWTYSLPANTLSANGKAVRIIAYGTLGATGNNKTIRLKVGGTNVAEDTTSLNGSAWKWSAIVIRTGAATEITWGDAVASSSVRVGTFTALTSDTTAAIVISVTGQNGTAAASDIVFRAALVEALN